jgi:FkbM family methyltransferase
MKNLINKVSNFFGYQLIPSWRLEHYSDSVFLARLFSYLNTDCVFDVGANTGQYRDFLRNQVGYRGWIVSFEPIPDHISTLQKSAKSDEKWIIEGYALGSECQVKNFNIMASTQFSSFLSPNHSDTELFLTSNKVTEEIAVDIKTLDEATPRIQSTLSCESLFLKLDTQGYDLEVLRGGENCIGCFAAASTEASVKPIYDNSPTYSDTINHFEHLGFELSGIFPNNPSQFPLLIEFDCYMLNKGFVPK